MANKQIFEKLWTNLTGCYSISEFVHIDNLSSLQKIKVEPKELEEIEVNIFLDTSLKVQLNFYLAE